MASQVAGVTTEKRMTLAILTVDVSRLLGVGDHASAPNNISGLNNLVPTAGKRCASIPLSPCLVLRGSDVLGDRALQGLTTALLSRQDEAARQRLEVVHQF